MKVSLKWLQDYVDITLSPKELAHKLTMAGIETGDIQTIGDGWENVFVGEVVNLGKHLNADRLQLALGHYHAKKADGVEGEGIFEQSPADELNYRNFIPIFDEGAVPVRDDDFVSKHNFSSVTSLPCFIPGLQ